MRPLPDPGFAGDDGSTPGWVREALDAYDRDPDRLHHATLARLQDARVLVPVVAVLGEAEYDEHGRARDKTSDMATVLMTDPAGRRGLLAFTGTEALHRWDPAGRPVPVSLPDAARAARHDNAQALLLDVAGPVPMVVQAEDLTRLAEGRRLLRVGTRWGWGPAPD